MVVESRPLTWDGRTLALGEIETETAVRSLDGVSMIAGLEAGDWVSLHWQVRQAHLLAQANHLRTEARSHGEGNWSLPHLRQLLDGGDRAGTHRLPSLRGRL